MIAKKKASVIVELLLCGGLLAVGLPSASHAQTVLYDNFNGRQLDPDKWTGQVGFDGDGASLELIRKLEGGRLLMSQRVVAASTSDQGQHFTVNDLLFLTPDQTAIQFDARVASFDLLGCTVAGSEGAFVLVRIRNSLFMDKDREGTFNAFLEIFQDNSFPGGPPNLLRVQASIDHPALAELPFPDRVRDLGTVLVGQRITLRMEWLPNQKRVDFQRDREAVISIPYDLDDSLPPDGPDVISTEVAAPNCTVGGRHFAEIAVFFDNVFVDP